MRPPMSIALRLGLGFGLILSLMLLVSLIGMQRVNFIDRTLTHVSENSALKQRYAINFRGSVHDRAIAIRDAVLVEDNMALQGHLREIDRLAGFYAESATPMKQLVSSPQATAEEKRLLAQINDIEQSTLALTTRLIAERQSGNREAAMRLLLHREYTLDVIASLCGFSGANYLCRVFKKTTGQSPTQWRAMAGRSALPELSPEQQRLEQELFI